MSGSQEYSMRKSNSWSWLEKIQPRSKVLTACNLLFSVDSGKNVKRCRRILTSYLHMGFQRTTISLLSSPAMLPSMVVYPSPTGDVVEFVRIATKYKLTITVPTGATNLDGHYHDHVEPRLAGC
ncbi:hypothetical protein BJ912DRAFT_276996 [Pholiota molesta]|nr:hypothetical protein BJ912DRAFT_276996 [Pholiota molesta]